MKKWIYLIMAALLTVVMLASCAPAESTTTTTPVPEPPQGSQGLSYAPTDDGTAWLVDGMGSCTDTAVVILGTHEGKPVTGIADNAFAGSGVVSITLPVGVTVIGDGAFADCNALVTVILPSSLTAIGERVFQNCSALVSITLPQSITTVGETAFDGCDALEKVTVTSKDIPAGLDGAVGEDIVIDVAHNEHTWESVAAKEMTCTEDGWEAHEKCTVCGYTEATYLKAPGHSVVVDEAGSTPTCTQSGYTEASHCDTCGETISEKKVLPPHNFENDVCTGCSVKRVKWDGTTDTSWYNSTDTVFVITTAEQLAGLAELVNGGTTFAGKTINLGVCIDLQNYGWTPIGIKSKTSFVGTFDGCGYTISNLTMSSELASDVSYYGLFGSVRGWSTIRNLGLINVTIDEEDLVYGASAGAIAGQLADCAVIDCYVLNGSISLKQSLTEGISGANINVGGLIGSTSTYKLPYDAFNVGVQDCFGEVTVYAEAAKGSHAKAGGLIGNASYTTVKRCYTTASVSGVNTISGSAQVGGLVGVLSTGDMSNSYATGTITATTNNGESFGGGLVGCAVNGSVITGCYATGTVSATAQAASLAAYAGGLVGQLYDTVSTITSCYAAGSVTTNASQAYVGGVTGKGGSTNCYRAEEQIINLPTGGAYVLSDAETDMPLEDILTVTFHTETLMWSTDVWNITDGSLPTLK